MRAQGVPGATERRDRLSQGSCRAQGAEAVLAWLGCHNKVLKIGGLNDRHLFSYSSLG